MKDRARQLRKAQTPAETVLWEKLRNRQLLGYKFRRQHIIGPYIVDFFCLEGRLVIELDGGHHRQQSEYDEQRTIYINATGYRVLRFWNDQMMSDLEAVLAEITETLKSPSPSGRGVGVRGEGRGVRSEGT